MSEDIPKIERGIPIPPDDTKGGKWTSIIRSLGVGDSFRAPRKGRSIASAVCNQHRRGGMRLVVRTVIEDGERWYRVWRVE